MVSAKMQHYGGSVAGEIPGMEVSGSPVTVRDVSDSASMPNGTVQGYVSGLLLQLPAAAS